MAIFRYLTFHMFISLICVTVSNSEIHRAKANGPKYGVKTSYSQEESYVADTLDIFEEDTLLQETKTGNMYDTKLETWMFSIFGAMLVGLSGIFPLLVIPIEAGPALKHGAAAARLKLLLSFAVGGLLGDVFLHLLPEAWAHLHAVGGGHDAHTRLGLWVIAGMLSFLIIEKMFAKEDEFEHLEDECSEAAEEERLHEAEEERLHEAEDERLHEADYQCQPLQEDLNGSTNINTDCIADRTRQSTQLDKNKTGSVNSDKKNERIKQKHENKTGAKYNHTDSVINRTKTGTHLNNTNNQTDQKNLVNKNISKSNGAVVSKKEDTQTSSIKVSGYLNLAANVIDNFTHGLAVAGGFLVNTKVGFVTLFAILLHEVPHEIGDFAILLRSGFDRWKAAKAQICTAASGVIGALTALTADSAWDAGESTVWILPFTSGGFIYIALVTVVPDLLQEIHPKESSKQILSLLAGIAAMYIVTCVH